MDPNRHPASGAPPEGSLPHAPPPPAHGGGGAPAAQPPPPPPPPRASHSPLNEPRKPPHAPFAMPPSYAVGPAATAGEPGVRPGAPTHHPAAAVPRRSPYGGPAYGQAPPPPPPSFDSAPPPPPPPPGKGRPPTEQPPPPPPPQGPAGREFRTGPPAPHGFPTGAPTSTAESSWPPSSQEPFSPSKHKPPSTMIYHPPLNAAGGGAGEPPHHADGARHLAPPALSLSVPGSAGASAPARGGLPPVSDLASMKGYPPRASGGGPVPPSQSPQPPSSKGTQSPPPPPPPPSATQTTATAANPQPSMTLQQHHAATAAALAAGRPAPPPSAPLPPAGGGALPPVFAAAKDPKPPPPPPQQPPPPPQQPPPPVIMRELRVEDALLYLDDVKREFRTQPGVYNEFLTIMKNFKTQAVDTPGVIQRVSKLFRGYNKLILGFNTFLPEGYKISLADLERNEALQRAEEEAEARRQQQQQQQQLQASQQQMQLDPTRSQASESASALLPFPAGSKPGDPSSATAAPGRGTKGSPRTMTTSATPDKAESQQGADSKTNASLAPESRDPSASTTPAKQGRSKARSGQSKKQQQQQQQIPPQALNPAVEFDHAISYVTQIKRRFANDPNTYHCFLDILHTYQKEQRGIKEVLEQVAHLFQDHPDLLKEFTFFLPDAVQEQAKERLHRAAAESESRLASQRQAQLEQYQKSLHPQQQQQQTADAGSAAASSQQQIIDMTSRNRRASDGAASAATSLIPSSGTRKRALEGQTVSVSHHPETHVYNSAVERQFFDLAKEALSSYARDGGQAWAEFMKCLDMYAQDILSRNEMLTFVEPLLGKRNAKLFEDFKRILASAGSTSGPTPPLEDAWYSVPLSEIDFSRCRRCTPSYRALPRDYPAPPCTERSDFEAKVLNDIWVSLPVGSEESYTFRHMRRNTYEEQLFRCEDERFEIDMVIDSNAATLQRLLPLAEEIARLSKTDMAMEEVGSKNAANEGAGLSGKRFQYSFDRDVLGVIHRNTIARIYGDSGQEILDLMVKNPVVTIPLVVERLRQKDREFKKARNRLRVDWRKLAETNYYKSLDHRSLTWRTTDKRATSTRTLLAEIKDRAQHRGKEGKEALRQKMDKAKEEHGTFFEVTMADTLSQDLDLTFLPKPDRLLFTPHLSVLYENNSWAQRDAYRMLMFALERGTISPHDKERCHRLWNEFLGPWFGLTVGWMHTPAVAYQESGKKRTSIVAPPAVISEEEEEDSMDDDADVGGHIVTEETNDTKTTDSNANNGGNKAADGVDITKDYHSLPVGCGVSTLYGEGVVLEYRASKRLYVVELPFGTAYLRPSTILSSLLPAEKSNYTDQLRAEDRSRLVRPTDQLCIGTQSLFLVFRLHQIVVRRLTIAMSLAHRVGQDKSLCTLVEQMPGMKNPEAVARRRYEAYLALVYSVLDGGHVGEYEDRVRSLLGHGAYELATMDKLISHLWKNMQAVAQDETMWSLIQLYRRHRDSGCFQPEAFRQEAAFHSEGEPMYAFQWCPMQGGKDQGVLHFEYLGVIAEEEDDDDMVMNEEEDSGDTDHPAVEPVPKRPRR